ncbi:hypothetical protein BCR33DRAFT_851529 [Rhizoclosmatium globosum]|uniref:DOP1-like middle TPR domain-containing protein n=1 Tax=Rhizoclosmatium globosum TaxID=329046 RepID=A0A1Y2C7B9_9FUNG|nr:hypothetical protein BCR33DRAFT_851529 [Rhizoclosmatium globosum]|eukprot:ORY42931.1 hypothetical protein BCR33DRAFT_851529 [Rhizoclosmatium globosum]
MADKKECLDPTNVELVEQIRRLEAEAVMNAEVLSSVQKLLTVATTEAEGMEIEWSTFLLLGEIYHAVRFHMEAKWNKLLQSAEMLLDSINPYTIWKHIYHLVIANPIGPCQTMQEYQLFDLMLGIVCVEEEDVKRIHLPILLCWLSYQLDTTLPKPRTNYHSFSEYVPKFSPIYLAKSMTKSWILKLSESNRSERIPMRPVESRKAGVKKTSPTSATGASNISISSSLPYGTVMNEAEETALDEPAVFQSPSISEFVIDRPVVELSFTNFQLFLTSLLDRVITCFGP